MIRPPPISTLFPTRRSSDLGEVLRAKANANFFEECGGGLAAGEDPDVIVRDFFELAVDIDDHGIFLKFHGIGIEDNFDLALADGFLDALSIALLDAAEAFLAVGERDLV